MGVSADSLCTDVCLGPASGRLWQQTLVLGREHPLPLAPQVTRPRDCSFPYNFPQLWLPCVPLLSAPQAT